VIFNSDGTFNAVGGYTSHNCNVAVSTLYANGQAFNFAKGPAAQWLQNGTAGYYNAGNVGIGTTAPASQLEVVKNFNGLANTSAGFIGGNDAGYTNSGVYFMQKDASGFGSNTTYLMNASINGSSKVVVTGTGNVGIGTASPGAKLSVSGGQAVGTFVSGSSATIDWNAGNIQATSAAAGTITFVANSMIDGGAYTLALNNATGGSYTFSSTGLTFRCSPACPVTVTAGQHTVAAMIKAGSIVYVSWVQGFQ